LEQGRGRKTVGKEKKGGGKGMERIQLRMSRGEERSEREGERGKERWREGGREGERERERRKRERGERARASRGEREKGTDAHCACIRVLFLRNRGRKRRESIETTLYGVEMTGCIIMSLPIWWNTCVSDDSAKDAIYYWKRDIKIDTLRCVIRHA